MAWQPHQPFITYLAAVMFKRVMKAGKHLKSKVLEIVNSKMIDAHNVIAQATTGIVDALAAEREISVRRCYELLGKDCPVPKAKRLIRDIARLNPKGARLIKADFDAMFAEIIKSDAAYEPDAIELHKEAFEAIQSVLTGKSRAIRAQELRELISVAQAMLEGCDKEMKLQAV